MTNVWKQALAAAGVTAAISGTISGTPTGAQAAPIQQWGHTAFDRAYHAIAADTSEALAIDDTSSVVSRCETSSREAATS